MSAEVVENDTVKLMVDLNHFTFFCGLPNIWIDGVKCSKRIVKFYEVYRKVSNAVTCIFILSEWASFLTQHNLSEKQTADMYMFSFSHPIMFTYIVDVELYTEEIKSLLFEIAVALKRVHNDLDVQREMIGKIRVYSTVFMFCYTMSMLCFGVDAFMFAISGEGTFTTVITCWPKVEVNTPATNAARVLIYAVWWLMIIKLAGAYLLVITTTVCLSHQYMNLQSYFYSLSNIFDEDIDQAEKEKKYEESFKIGIKMHSSTLSVTKQFQKTLGVIFNGQILMNVTVIVVLMLQMMTMEHRLTTVFPIVLTGVCLLFGTGFFMCKAGDITEESAELATAMYSSGWHHCRSPAAARARRLLAVSMAQARIPVVIWALGLVMVSYQSYLSIVKSSYSLFSVLY